METIDASSLVVIIIALALVVRFVLRPVYYPDKEKDEKTE